VRYGLEGKYVCGIAHEDYFTIFEDPIFVRQSIVEGPTSWLVFHESNQFLDHWIPPLVYFENLRFGGFGYP
jgi:hypothetical protein